MGFFGEAFGKGSSTDSSGSSMTIGCFTTTSTGCSLVTVFGLKGGNGASAYFSGFVNLSAFSSYSRAAAELPTGTPVYRVDARLSVIHWRFAGRPQVSASDMQELAFLCSWREGILFGLCDAAGCGAARRRAWGRCWSTRGAALDLWAACGAAFALGTGCQTGK